MSPRIEFTLGGSKRSANKEGPRKNQQARSPPAAAHQPEGPYFKIEMEPASSPRDFDPDDSSLRDFLPHLNQSRTSTQIYQSVQKKVPSLDNSAFVPYGTLSRHGVQTARGQQASAALRLAATAKDNLRGPDDSAKLLT